MGGGSTIYFCYPAISQPRAWSHITHCRSSWMVLLKVHIFSIWVRFFLLRSLLSPKIHHASPSASHAVGNLRTNSTGSRALHDLAGVRLSFSARLLQRSWLARWRAWFRANKLLPDRARRLPPPGRGGCGAGRIPAEPRAAGGGGAASPCAGTLTSPRRRPWQ